MYGNAIPDIANLNITTNGVEKLLTKLVTSKAPGPDNIPNTLLKELSAELAPVLTSLFNQSLHSGQLPDDWKNANVSPVFKKDDKHTASNYRPVSLTCVCCKLMEHIVVSHLLDHMDLYSILSKLQHGFRKFHSCTSQLLLTVSDLANQLNSNKQVDICVLDFSKAFDVVSHRKLLAKLSHYGIRGDILTWIQSFLTNRKQSIVVEGVSSKQSDVLSGVPQGTCLGPILFLCYINDITNNIDSQLRLFADDALLYRPINSPADHNLLQQDLYTLESWANDWDMKFNAKKCYILSSKRTANKSSHLYTLGGHVLQSVPNNPYLGVTLSEDLTFSTHLRNITSKASRTLGFLRRNLRSCPAKLKETAYTTMCRSTLEYAATIWDPYLATEINQLERIQRKAARFVAKDFRRTTSVTQIMQHLKWEPLADRRKNHRLTLLYQIVNNKIAVPSDIEFLKPGRNGRFIHLTHKHQAYKHSFFPQTIRDWNSLPPTTRDSPSLDTFKTRLPTHSYD